MTLVWGFAAGGESHGRLADSSPASFGANWRPLQFRRRAGAALAAGPWDVEPGLEKAKNESTKST